MKVEKRLRKRRQRRTFRVRNKVRRSANGRHRLSVFRANRHMYAQIIDDTASRTVASASTLEKDLFGSGKYAGNCAAAAQIGKLIAERALEQGIRKVVFDRAGYQHHGRVAALTGAAREGGLEF